MSRVCPDCEGLMENPKLGYCNDCRNIRTAVGNRKTRALPLLKQRAQKWSDARLAIELEWVRTQLDALREEAGRRLSRNAKGAGGR